MTYKNSGWMEAYKAGWFDQGLKHVAKVLGNYKMKSHDAIVQDFYCKAKFPKLYDATMFRYQSDFASLPGVMYICCDK